jgi:hypothetical protein
MSRVFEALTAAVDEKQNPAKPEVSGTESQGDLIVGFPPVRQAESASNEIPSSLHSPTTEATLQSCHSESDPDQKIRGLDKHERDSEDCRHFFKVARTVVLLAAMSLIVVYLADRFSNSRASQYREHNR